MTRKILKKRKPRGVKLNGRKSLDMCPHCYAFHCDSMTMSDKFNAKSRERVRQGVCVACGASPCKCKSRRVV